MSDDFGEYELVVVNFSSPKNGMSNCGLVRLRIKPRFRKRFGIMAYGAAYFFVHDVFIHQRFKILKNTDSAYFKGLRKGHKVHHKHLGKEDSECFGMLWVPMKYFKEAARSRAKSKRVNV